MSAGRTNNQELKSVEWCTSPKHLTPILKFLGEIDLDPCSNQYSLVPAKTKFQLPDKDGLIESWKDYNNIYCNPPFGCNKITKTSIYDWVEKCCLTNELYRNEILLMIPVSVNTSHYKEIIFKKSTGLCFLSDSRVKFWQNGIEDPKGCPVAIAIIYWGNKNRYREFEEIFSDYGKCFQIL